jgi:hypothetical protein
MGKRRTTIVASTIVAKKVKRTTVLRDPKAPKIGEWNRSKFLDKDTHKAMKDELLKDDAEEVRVPGPETTPTPPA